MKERKIRIKSIPPKDKEPPGWAKMQKEFYQTIDGEESLILIHVFMEDIGADEVSMKTMRANMSGFKREAFKSLGYNPIILFSRKSDGISIELYEEDNKLVTA